MSLMWNMPGRSSWYAFHSCKRGTDRAGARERFRMTDVRPRESPRTMSLRMTTANQPKAVEHKYFLFAEIYVILCKEIAFRRVCLCI